ncbi:MAG: DUF6114 domain-containing protein [Desulfurococcaceae archaeon]
MSEKPTAAFVLSLIGGILVLLPGILVFNASELIGEILPEVGEVFRIVGFADGMSGLFMVVGALMINSGELSGVKIGSIIVLVCSILSLIFGIGGFYIGSILGLIGGTLGLTWKPPQKPPAPSTTTQ